jgi:23S rRNA pseudouridine2457 synthase
MNFRYFVINKPYGMLSQFTPEAKYKTLKELFDFPKDVYPVGRLDTDSEGLLIITNDKKLNSLLLHPSQGHWRTYHAQVEGNISEFALQLLRKGVGISVESRPHHSKPARVSVLTKAEHEPRIPPVRYRKNIPDSWVSISLTEGKNRQVRRMLAAVGFPVLRLIRVAIEDLRLDGLKTGGVREAGRDEMYRKLKIIRL